MGPKLITEFPLLVSPEPTWVIAVGDPNNGTLYQTPIGSIVAGPQGMQGIQGLTGVQGYQGGQGFQGRQGLTGTQGPIGNQGVQGNDGIQGNQGLQGVQGFIGNQGVQGLAGNQGIDGAQGFQGFLGNQGVQGVTGVQGNQGNQGSGLQGSAGPQGPQGLANNLNIYNSDGTFSAARNVNANSNDLTIENLDNFYLFSYSGQLFFTTDYSGSTGELSVDNDFQGFWSSTTASGTSLIYNRPPINTSSPGVELNTIRGSSFSNINLYIDRVDINQSNGDIRFLNIFTSSSPTQSILSIDSSGRVYKREISGFQGPAGSGGTGSQGNQGWQGNDGTNGTQGNQGSQGFQGYQGLTGDQGTQGYQGQGFQGFQGQSAVGVLPYQVFTIRTTQNGINDPVYFIYLNTLEEGFIPPFTRNSVGSYIFDFSEYPYNLDQKILAFCNTLTPFFDKFVKIYAAGENKEVYVETYIVDFPTGTITLSDSIMLSTDIEIRVYP